MILRHIKQFFNVFVFAWKSWFGFLLWTDANLDAVSYFEVPRTDLKVVFTLKRDDWVTVVRTETKGQLCMLSLEENGGVIPIARSYDGYDWERAGGQFAGRLQSEWKCVGPAICTTLLPKGKRFVLRTRQVSEVHPDAETARFLESASFGATPRDIEVWGGRDREEYVQSQIYSQPPTFHREYFRRRANSIWPHHKREAAGALDPCGPQSSWRQQVITVWDRNEKLQLDRVGDLWKVTINGQVRTFAEELRFVGSRDVQVSDGKQYRICSADNEIRRGLFGIFIKNKCQHLEEFIVFFPDDQLPENMLVGPLPDLDNLSWKRTSDFVPEYLLRTRIDESRCAPIAHLSGSEMHPIFAVTVSGVWMQHNPRVVLERNTLEAPQRDGGLSNVEQRKTEFCTNVRRSFLNEESCVMTPVSSCYWGGAGESDNKPASRMIICGSPGEVDNDPSLGDEWIEFSAYEKSRDNPALNVDVAHVANQRESIWASIALTAQDQLRQRAAWALFQIFALPKTDAIGSDSRITEPFLNYYDIFVRSAFKNYRNILHEIAFNPLMSRSLSYVDSASTSYVYEKRSKIVFPDENFARELMQLFTIGLVKLNDDGTPLVDASNRTIRTYDNDHIVSFARAWTGFERDEDRANIEGQRGNYIDPLRIDPNKRDRFPKQSLDEHGYLGDGFPLCEDLPPRPFLRIGAKYRLLGSSPSPELIHDTFEGVLGQEVRRLKLDEQNSQLHRILCAGTSGLCSYPSIVVLSTNIPCYGEECVDMIRVVQVGSVFYEYINGVPCVHQAFFSKGVKVSSRYRSRPAVCAKPGLPVASAACCDVKDAAEPSCMFGGERMLQHTASRRCYSIGRQLCDYRRVTATIECPYVGYHWTNVGCSTLVKVNQDGGAAIVHALEDPLPHVAPDSPSYFKVYWKDGEYPRATSSSCGVDACFLFDGSCICSVEVKSLPAFKLPPNDAASVLSQLKIGHAPPNMYDTAQFLGFHHSDYKYYSRDGGCCDERTVFEVSDPHTGRTVYLKNEDSIVHIYGSKFQFRNCPHFNSLVPSEFTVSDAQQETFALLEHLLHHPNTPSFVAYRIIQRFGCSNPTPRYTRVVAEAFRTGNYRSSKGHEFGSDDYGDLAATFAAVFLDREARSTVLDGDPFFGSLREPCLKVLGLLRATDFKSNIPYLDLNLMDEKIGQMAYEQKTVFSFFRPQYSPPGEAARGFLVAPEVEVMSSGKIIGLLNGLFSLVRRGLSRCENGFGRFGDCKSRVPSGTLQLPRTRDTAQRNEAVRTLAYLLTGGRLEEHKLKVIQRLVDEELDEEEGLRAALQLLLTTPEFHSTNKLDVLPQARPVITSQNVGPNKASNYKAVIHLSLRGGCDSYNLLVPHPSCQLSQSYKDIRDSIALSDNELLRIDGETSNQPCKSFGLHHKLSFLRDLYNEGDLAFLANVGVLSEPVTSSDYRLKTVTQLFAHNAMQAEVDRIDPFNRFQGTGTLGRMAERLFEKGYRTSRTSIEAAPNNLAGQLSTPPPIYALDESGVVPLDTGGRSSTITREAIAELNSGNRSGVFGELWSSVLYRSLNQTEKVHHFLRNSEETAGNFSTSPLGKRFKLISQLIDKRQDRSIDRDHFFVEFGGWDHHVNLLERLDDKFTELNGELKNLVSHLKTTGAWEDVVIVQTSDFARTLTPNTGDGSDHGYGGIAFVTGGSIRGNAVLGEYPSDLNGELNVGRGRILPTMPWESPFNAIAEWMGVESEELDFVLPNRDKFRDLLGTQDLFA